MERGHGHTIVERQASVIGDRVQANLFTQHTEQAVRIKARLETELQKMGGLSDIQFRFVKGGSMARAIKAVVDKINESGKKWVTVIALDVKITFNSAS